MKNKLCFYLGAAAGGYVGLLVELLHQDSCCVLPVPPSWARLATAGLMVSIPVVLIGAAFVCLVKHLPIKPVLTLALLVCIVTGVLLGPLAYHLHNPGLSLFVCLVLGALLGWLVCRAVCGGARGLNLEASR
jgi:hypothetical protein